MNTTKALTDDEVGILLAAAVHAPSMDNTQPWRFEVAGPVIDVRLDEDLVLPAADPAGRAIRIGLGAAAFNLRVAAAMLGHESAFAVTPDPAEPEVVARIYLSDRSGPITDLSALYGEISRRHTYRGPMLDQAIPPTVISALTDAAEIEGAELHWPADDATRTLGQLLRQADDLDLHDEDRLLERGRWVGGERPHDGVPDTALGPVPTDPAMVRDLATGSRHTGPGARRLRTASAHRRARHRGRGRARLGAGRPGPGACVADRNFLGAGRLLPQSGAGVPDLAGTGPGPDRRTELAADDPPDRLSGPGRGAHRPPPVAGGDRLGRSRAMNDWIHRFGGYDPADERRREALCTVGNGYFATRGAWAGAVAGDHHYPGTYLAGYYNRLTDQVNDHVRREREPGEPAGLAAADGRHRRRRLAHARDTCEVLEHDQELDLLRGVLTRRFRLRDPHGREVRGVERRFVSMAEPHLAGQTLAVTAVNWEGRLRLGTAVNGAVCNAGVERYRKLSGRHLTDLSATVADGNLMVAATTSQSRHRVAVGDANHCRPQRIAGHGVDLADRRDTPPTPRSSSRSGSGDVVTAEKVAAIYGSRDPGISEPLLATRTALANAPRLRPTARRPRAGLVTPVAAVLARSRGAVRRHPGRCPAEPLPPAPIGLAAQRRHRCRRTRSRPARGGVPGPHLLGRAVRLSGPHLAHAGADAGTPAVPVPAAARRPASGPAGGLSGSHVSRGSPAATAARRASGCISTRCPAAGARTRPSGNGTSAWRSPTPCGSTSS